MIISRSFQRVFLCLCLGAGAFASAQETLTIRNQSNEDWFALPFEMPQQVLSYERGILRQADPKPRTKFVTLKPDTFLSIPKGTMLRIEGGMDAKGTFGDLRFRLLDAAQFAESMKSQAWDHNGAMLVAQAGAEPRTEWGRGVKQLADWKPLYLNEPGEWKGLQYVIRYDRYYFANQKLPTSESKHSAASPAGAGEAKAMAGAGEAKAMAGAGEAKAVAGAGDAPAKAGAGSESAGGAASGQKRKRDDFETEGKALAGEQPPAKRQKVDPAQATPPPALAGHRLVMSISNQTSDKMRLIITDSHSDLIAIQTHRPSRATEIRRFPGGIFKALDFSKGTTLTLFAPTRSDPYPLHFEIADAKNLGAEGAAFRCDRAEGAGAASPGQLHFDGAGDTPEGYSLDGSELTLRAGH